MIVREALVSSFSFVCDAALMLACVCDMCVTCVCACIHCLGAADTLKRFIDDADLSTFVTIVNANRGRPDTLHHVLSVLHILAGNGTVTVAVRCSLPQSSLLAGPSSST